MTSPGWSPVGGGEAEGHQSSAARLPVSSPVEELVWFGGIGGMVRGCVGQ